MDVQFGKSGSFVGNGERKVRVQADGLVGSPESAGVDHQADGFLPSIQDDRIGQYLRSSDAAALGGTWQSIPDDFGQRHKRLSADCGDERVWKYGGTQQVNADFGARTVSLDTLGRDGRHTISAHFERGSGHVVPQTITESFEPYNSAYVAMMRDNY